MTAEPLAVHADEGYDALMRDAIRAEESWQHVTRTHHDRVRALEWLDGIVTDVHLQLSSREAEHEALDDVEFEVRDPAYREWRKRAYNYLRFVNKRRATVKAEVKAENARRMKVTTERARKRKEARQAANDFRAHERVQQQSWVIFGLGDAIAAHEAGTLSDADLHALLDSTMVPQGPDGNAPLRTVLTAIAEAEARKAAEATTEQH